VRPAWSTTAGRLFLRLRTTAAGGEAVSGEETEARREAGRVVVALLLREGRDAMDW
jgi:hypothetical protein